MTANERMERDKNELKRENVRTIKILVMAIAGLLCVSLILYILGDIENCVYVFLASCIYIIPALIFYSILEIGPNKTHIKFLDACIERNLEDERVKPDVKKQFNLSNEYIEIFLKDKVIINEEEAASVTFRNENDYNKKKIQRDCGGRFYARLVSDDEAEIIVKGLDEKNVDEPQKVTRFGYLREYFNPKITV